MNMKGLPPFSVLICYETIFPDLARAAVAEGAGMLINITNDGWFGDSAAPYQHLAMAGMRSVENRVWLVRSANTGISAAFDPTGHMVSHIPLDYEGVSTVRVPYSAVAGSFYTRFGDLFALSCIAVSVLLGLALINFGKTVRREA
jgi:apolipoprotein N-acyltransferase